MNTAVQSTLAKPSAAENLQIIDELPPEASYNGSCTAAQTGGTPPSLVEYNKDRYGNAKLGYTRLLWNFGNVTANTIIPPRIFCTDTDPLAPHGTSVVNYAEIRADNVITALSARSDTHSIRLEQTGSIQVAKKVDMPLDDLDDDQVYTLSWANFAPAFKINKPTIIDVLPFMSGDGDGADAKSARTPASNFHGKLTLTAAPTITWLDGNSPTGADPFPTLGDWFYSSDAPETINYNPDDNATEATTKWCLESAFGTSGCPANFAAVTALKFVSHYDLEKDGNPRKGMTAQFTLQAGDTTDPNSANANKPGDIYTNRFAFDTTSIDPPQFLRSNNVSVQVAAYSIGDFIFADNNQNGMYDAGVDAPAPDGVTVDLYNSADKKIATTTTGVVGAGRFLFQPLSSGSYYVKIPASQFQTGGKLFGWKTGLLSEDAKEADDKNEAVDQHGYSVSGVTSSGVRTGLIELSANPPPPGGVPTGNEPTGDNAQPIADPTGDDFSNLTLDIALIPPPSSLGDTVWNDINQNGIQDVGEQGLSNVLVKLLNKSGVELKNVRTDGAGKYVFTELAGGEYFVEVVKPTGYFGSPKDQLADDLADSDVDAATGRTALITLGVGVNLVDVDAGLYKAAGIGDRVWLDSNADGKQDPTETTNLANVTVVLKSGTDAVLATTTTDANGNYLFSGLKPGFYKVDIEETDADLVGYSLTSNNDPHSVTLAEGQAYVDADFGFINYASVGDLVWEDLNGNGLQDAGEPGVAGVVVRLLDKTGATVVKTTTTDANGLYLFSSVLPGEYLVEFAKPAAYKGFVTADQGADNAKDSDVNVSTGRTSSFVLAGATNLRDIDAGLYKAANLGDTLWFDADADGVQDVNEVGVSGVRVTLTGTRGDGVALTAVDTNTDATGKYAFTDLYPGNYSVKFNIAANMKFTLQDQAGDDAADSDVVPATGLVSATLISGASNTTLDAGVLPATVSGRVWSDNNTHNSIDDDGVENGVVGVTVNLMDAATGKVVATTTSGVNGAYSFTGVLPGNYKVQVLQPANMEFVLKDEGGNDTKDSDVDPANGTSHSFPVASGDAIVDVDAGIKPGSLGDRVWLDLNGNNLQDSGEPGVPNVVVNLLDGTNAVVATQTTDATGFYNFAALLPGNYTVQFVPPAGMTLVGANQGKDDTLDSDPAGDGKVAVTVVSGVGNQTVDAGIVPAKLGDYVWLDSNGDGKQDAGEPPVVGMTVKLLDKLGAPVLDAGGNAMTATTDAAGKYQFSVLPGEYSVKFVLPANAAFTQKNQGAADKDSDADITTGVTAVVTVASGADNPTLDAGLATARISGAVIKDANANGVKDAGEVGIAGVTVTLSGVDALGHSVNATATTDANGAYNFAVLPGTYTLKETNPVDYLSSGSIAGTAIGAAVVSVDELTTPVPGGGVSANNDFLDYHIGSIAGQVRHDADYDASLTDTDEGIAGVTITLFTDPNNDGNPADGVSVATATTNATGNYLFSAVKPGSYVIVETDLDKWESTADIQAANDNRIALALASGQDSIGNDYLDAKRKGSLSGVVWTDASSNGARDAGETALANVTVLVLDSAGNTVATLTTLANGSYRADNLPPGTYSVKVTTATLPAGVLQTADPDALKDHQTSAAVNAGAETSGLDFGYVGSASVGDRVWEDLNGNGEQDANENGVAGVTVRLLNSAGDTVIKTTTTDVNGEYLFTHLAPGDYQIEFAKPETFSGFVTAKQGGDTAKDSDADLLTGRTAVFTLAGGAAPRDVDAGLYKAANLGDTLWFDADGDGKQDVNEAGMAATTVTLTGTRGDGTAITATDVTTDAAGNYRFSNLYPGTYSVKFNLPAGMGFTLQDQGADDSLDSDVAAAGTVSATLKSGETNLTLDAGVRPASISGRVWSDNNTPNSIDDDGAENGVVGVTVNLLDATSGKVIATTTSGADGVYTFTGVVPGNYSVQVLQPANMEFVLKDEGGNDTKDSDVDPANGTSHSFPVASGDAIVDVDAGIKSGSLGDRVWLDLNGNNLQDSGEPGVPNVTVKLLDGTNKVVDTKTTDASGFYNFAAVLPGNYTVQFETPAGMTLVGANQGTDDTLDSDPSGDGKVAVTVVSGVGNQTVDAGVVPAKLGDYVWLDTNGDGKQDAGEPPVAGITVALLDKAGAPVLDVAGNAVTTLTDAAGKYQFVVLPGEYSVKFTLPTGAAFTQAAQGTAEQDSNADTTTGSTTSVTLASGASDQTLDAGLAPARISGTVLKDLNANGVKDSGETGIAGVTITLTGVDALGQPVTATATTDANGVYSFAVLPGTYTLKETTPVDYLSSGSLAGSATGAAIVNEDELTTPAVGGATSEHNDFLDYRVGSIAGQVRNDSDYDGSFADADAGIAGVTITLFTDPDGNGDPADGVNVGTATTNSAGSYVFNAVKPGNYVVVETDLEQWASTADIQGGNDNRIPLALASAQTSTGNDFLDAQQKGSLSGVVWTDAKPDGMREPTETGLANIKVLVLDADGKTVATLQTTPDGAYKAEGLPPGKYSVKVDATTLPAGVLQTADPDALKDHQTATTVTAGAETSGLDFGYVGAAALGDKVWDDLNANGLQDAGEPGVAGVTVHLLDASGMNILKTTTTTSAGLYRFEQLLPGDYRVEFKKPETYAGFVAADVAPDEAADSDAVDIQAVAGAVNGRTAVITLAGGANLLDVDAGLYKYASIGDVVWFDSNGDGIQQASETGVSGVTVTLGGKLGNGNDVPPQAAQTDANGKYQFSNLYPGAYDVVFTLPTGMAFTTQDEGTDLIDSDAAADGKASVTLKSGENNQSIDAGVQPATVTGRVWTDSNTANGVEDAPETGVIGVSVSLINTATQAVVATTTTGADGVYTFTGVLPGSYQVQVQEPANMGFVEQDKGGDDVKDSDVGVEDGKSHTFNVASGTTVSDVDAGIAAGALGDRVWLDLNGNNLQDSGEPGVANVVVNLLDSKGATVDTQTTDANGFYNFAAVQPGDYSVKFVPPTGMTFVTAKQGTDTTLDSDPAADGEVKVTVISGVGNQTVDAGIVPAKLGDYVWLDLNGDGTQGAGEPAVAGVTVNLLDKESNPVKDAGGNPLTALTDATGKYQFTVLPGEYRVEFVLPDLAAFTKLKQGANPAADSDADLTTGITAAVTVVSGDNHQDLDAGLPPAVVSGYVIEDTNADGNLDAAETALKNVTVTLTGTDVFGTPVTATTTTNDNGEYSFTVPAGNYTLVATNLVDYLSSGSQPGTATGAAVVNADTLTTPVSSGGKSENNNFFDYRVGSIAGQVRNDLNYNGNPADTDNGIGGVTITLFTDPDGNGDSSDGVQVAKTATDSEGRYLFTNLKPQNYVVVEADLAKWQSTFDVTAPNDNKVLVVLASAQNSTGNDFLDALQKGTLTGVVWTDSDTDGIRDPDEALLANITVTVVNAAGETVATLTTGADGVYTAADLPPGDYTVKVDPTSLAAGTQQTGDPDGLFDHQTPAEVLPMQTTSGLDFGYIGLVSVGDKVWHDLNANGVQDAEEPGLAGVMVTLYRDVNADGVAQATEQVKASFTATNGEYRFEQLLPLDYLVTFSLPDGYQRSLAQQGDDTALDSNANASGVAAVSLKSGSSTAVDAGYYQLGSIGDYVWLDVNEDGIQNAKEPAIVGLEVQLLNKASEVVATTTTNAEGQYLFNNKIPGDYSVKFVTPEGIVLTKTAQGDNRAADSDPAANGSALVTLVSGQHLRDTDAGILPAAISGRVWIDRNANAQDDTESGVVGVSVKLVDVKTGEMVATTTTGSEGQYSFSGILPGEYRVEITQPANMKFVTPDTGGDDAVDSDVQIADGHSPNFVLKSTDSVTNLDAGIEPGGLGDRVWVDENLDGIQDAGELGLANVTVNLLDSSGKTVLTQTTDANGFYNFTGVLPGEYRVQVVLPEGAQFTATDRGTDDDLDSDVDAAGNVAVTVVSTVGNQSVDAGVKPALISGAVLDDLNANGVQDANEPVVAGVVITLTGTDLLGNPVIKTTTTAADGTYSFIVPPGTYSITETTPDGAVSTGSEAGTQGSTVVSMDVVSVVVTSGQTSTQNDFLNYQPASISGQVRNDIDADAAFADLESGVANVSVTLWQGDTQIGTPTTTDANGFYTFTGLKPGVYSVRATDLDGWISTADVEGANDNQINVTVASGEDKLAQDFLDSGLGSIGDTVWLDANENALQDPNEVGISGITVVLSGADGAGLAVNATTTTDANGKYNFAGLKPGVYTVEFTLPEGMQLVPAAQGAARELDSDPDMISRKATITLLSGEQNRDLDAGVAPAILMGFAWEDTDGNGQADPFEPILPGVGVTVFTDPNGDGDPADGVAVATTTTNPNGEYEVAGLLPGAYVVVVNPPATYTLVAQDQGNDDGVDSDIRPNLSVPVTLVSADISSVDAGFYRAGGFGNRVWLDVNANGVQDESEPSVRDVTLVLLDNAGNPVMRPAVDQEPPMPYRVVSDVNGLYQFTGLLPGKYQVQLEDMTGFVFTQTDAGADDAKDSDTNANGRMTALVTSDGFNDTVDAGVLPASVTGRVWLDHSASNGTDDGLYDEPGAVGITVNLLDKNGTIVDTTTTGADGIYHFTGVLPGEYRVAFVMPETLKLVEKGVGEDLAVDSDADPETGLTDAFTVTSTNTITNLDAGVVAGALGDRVWTDLNENGMQDEGEPGVAGITVKLINAKGKTMDTQVTDASGFYAFRDVAPATYSVQFVVGALKLTAAQQGEDRATDSNADPATGIATVTVGSGTSGDQTIDAGILPAKIGDYVWLDSNRNGIQDEGETPLANVSVTLLNEDGGFVAATTTDAQGKYQFAVPEGKYSIQVVSLDSSFTPAKQGEDRALDSDVDASGTSPLQAYLSGSLNDAVDVGITPAVISGKVLNDLWANGTIEPEDGGLGGVTITVTGTDSFGNPVTMTTTTGEDGSYQLLVPPGTYTVSVTHKPGFVATGSTPATTDGSVVIDHEHLTVVVKSGSDAKDASFLAYDPSTWVAPAGKVIDDHNHDTQAGVTERGLVGVSVALYTDPNGDSDPADGRLLETVLTDVSGTFTFAKVPPGRYLLVETDPANYESTADSADKNDNRIPFTLVASEAPQGLMFLDAEPKGSLTGYVRPDPERKGDLTQASGGIAGVTLELFTDPDGNGDPSDGVRIATVVTDADGRYAFDEVITGHYVIVEKDKPAHISTADRSEGNDNRIPVLVSVADGKNTCTLPDGNVGCTGLDFLDSALKSEIKLLKTAYQGHDAGAKCGTDAATSELSIVDIDKDKQENVTYCFEITNPGETGLAQIALVDNTLNLTAAQLKPLGTVPTSLVPLSKDANARIRYYYEHRITTSLVNTATVTAKPVLEDGTVFDAELNAQDESTAKLHFIFDPPSAYKTVTATGDYVMLWQMVWINSSSDSVAKVKVYDGVPEGTHYAAMSAGEFVSADGVYCEARGTSVTETCKYEAPSADYPRGRVIWIGTIGADVGNVTEATAANEVVIRFYSMLDKAGEQQTISNQAHSSWDLDGDGKPEYDDITTDNGGTDDPNDTTDISLGSAAQIPTLGEWSLLFLSLLMVWVAFGYQRRGRKG
ncbi:IPTL-CTERM sorting domain-containing protein [Thiothrix unzii]|uniref:IPTL-CTERM sorting domain-containing protein n=1 Tax=Thiothrix unzii TaxID=111769 RepID=UPI001AEF0119|nr:IPTL-CTERM sorting domain-containing protein [Thiothrix unzii]